MLKNNEKLIAAFMLPAMTSSSCGAHHPQELRESHKKQLTSFIAGKESVQLSEIIKDYPKLVQRLQTKDPRDYFYLEHYETVRTEIEETFGLSFEKAVLQNEAARTYAQHCPVQFYEVNEGQSDVSKEVIKVTSVFGKQTQLIRTLKGLEIPTPRNILSGHWNQMLEVIDNYHKIYDSIKLMEKHYLLIESALKPK